MFKDIEEESSANNATKAAARDMLLKLSKYKTSFWNPFTELAQILDPRISNGALPTDTKVMIRDTLVSEYGLKVSDSGHASLVSECNDMEVLFDAARDAMIAAGGDPERITAIGVGEDMPIADNSTVEGRALNRRVELTIVPGDDTDA